MCRIFKIFFMYWNSCQFKARRTLLVLSWWLCLRALASIFREYSTALNLRHIPPTIQRKQPTFRNANGRSLRLSPTRTPRSSVHITRTRQENPKTRSTTRNFRKRNEQHATRPATDWLTRRQRCGMFGERKSSLCKKRRQFLAERWVDYNLFC